MNHWNIEEQAPSACIDAIVAGCPSSGPKTVVCFDYFDTLTVRSVEPEHTKVMAASVLGMLSSGWLSGEKLYSLRQQMEKTLCQRNAAAGGDLEFNIEELAFQIYDELKGQAQNALDDCSRQRFGKIMLSTELAVECTVQRPCRPVVELLEAVHRHGCTTILISDFYLPGRYFKKMLKYHGLEELLDRIYISADHDMTKGSGRLYRRIMRDVGCRPEQMVMIGDNPHADIKMAAELGIQTIRVENPRQQAFYRRWRERFARQKNRPSRQFALSLKKDACFPEMGLTLWLFICRLFQALRKIRARHVFFFSKEGELLKRLFDDFQKTLFGTEVIETNYLVVSRKATFVASLRPLGEETFSRLFNHYRDISLRDFMLSLNMDEKRAEMICNASGLDFEKRYTDLQSQPVFKRLLQSGEFREAYEALRLQQKSAFAVYLDSFGVDYKKEGLFIVDVGWKGSIQDNIYHILGGDISVQGFYIGSLIATELQENNRKTGILFSDRPAPSRFFNVYNNNRSLFEMMLGASHGSADGYYRKADAAEKPGSRKQQVYTRISDGDGEVSVMVLDLPEERRLFEEVISPLQRNIAETAASCTRQFMLNECGMPGDRWFARQHARMVFRPTGAEVDFFERLYHLENFGVFEYTTFRRGSHASWEQRWANFKGVLLHPDLLESGIWPPIILRRMGVGPLRYYDGWRRSLGEFGLRW